jgi:adenylosuccinate synthase
MTNDARAILVVDLAFGDCGKGTVVDFFTRACDARTIVRFNGGPQAGHNVVTPDGRHHTFSQFGSGTFVPGVRTFLSRFMLIEPYALLNEAAHLEQVGVSDALDRLFIDGRCAVITPAQQAANRLRELARGDGAHGTCGVGVGEAVQDQLEHPELTLRAGELQDRHLVAKKLRGLRDLKVEQLREQLTVLRSHPRAQIDVQTLLEPSWLETAVDKCAYVAYRSSIIDESWAREMIAGRGTTIFEGAQGVLLDERFGFFPHTTWSKTTFENADTLLDEAGFPGQRARLGVLRTYFTRHGAGPVVTEDHKLRANLPEPHNDERGWQGAFRVGPFDAVAARYALSVTGPVDGLAVTHIDRLDRLPPQICSAYRTADGRLIADLPIPVDLSAATHLTRLLEQCRPDFTELPNDDSRSFIPMLRDRLSAPVGITSNGPTAHEKQVLMSDLLLPPVHTMR